MRFFLFDNVWVTGHMQYLKECWNYVRSMQILVLICSTVYFEFGLLRLNTSRSKLSPSNAKKQMWKHHPVRLFGRRGALHVPRLWDWSRSHGSSTNSHAWICPDTWFSYILWIFATINVCFWLAVLQFEEVKVALLFFAESFVFSRSWWLGFRSGLMTKAKSSAHPFKLFLGFSSTW